MTTNLLIFFAIPLAVIVFSIALQKVLRNPFLVAAIIFSILLIIALAFFDAVFLIAVVAYTILAFITAVLTCLIGRCLRNKICDMMCNNGCGEEEGNNIISIPNNGNVGIDNSNYSTCDTNNVGNSCNFSGMTGTYVRSCRR